MKEVLAVGIALAASFCVNYSSYIQKKAVDALPNYEGVADRRYHYRPAPLEPPPERVQSPRCG